MICQLLNKPEDARTYQWYGAVEKPVDGFEIQIVCESISLQLDWILKFIHGQEFGGHSQSN